MLPEEPPSFLNLIQRSARGRFKLYLGFAPGVGKTYQMLREARSLAADGVDVALAAVETHGRKETEALLTGLPRIPPRIVEYRGIRLEELDVDAVIARRPEVAVVDELAHTNAPGSRNPKRFQDVMELLHAGIHVVSALNIQHLESLFNTMERLVGVKVAERVPDFMLAEADQIIHVDLSVEDLVKRLREGRIYPNARVPSALEHFFHGPKLAQLRELALWETAARLEQRQRLQEPKGVNQPDQVMVALGSWGGQGEALLRFGSRLAGRLHRNWYAVHVQTPEEDPTRIPADRQRHLSKALALANELGATVFTLSGQDIVETLLRFAREYGVGHLIAGKERPSDQALSRLRRRWFGHSGVADRLLRRAEGLSLVFYDEAAPAPPPAALPAESARPRLAALLDPGRILIQESPIERGLLLKSLVEMAMAGREEEAPGVLEKVNERERLASTFLNEGIALPHARIDVDAPRCALAILKEGIRGDPGARATEWVLLLLTPEGDGPGHLELMAEAVRSFQDRTLRRQLRKARTGEAALASLLKA